MKTKTLYTCEFCGRDFDNAADCINHEKECDYRIKFYDKHLNLLDSLEPNSLNGVSYIRVPNYTEYLKLIDVYPSTAVLHITSLADFPIIICRTALSETEWMLFSDYYTVVRTII